MCKQLFSDLGYVIVKKQRLKECLTQLTDNKTLCKLEKKTDFKSKKITVCKRIHLSEHKAERQFV